MGSAADLLKKMLEPIKGSPSETPQMGGANTDNDASLCEAGNKAACDRLAAKKKEGAATKAMKK